jgi:hypothetical protein
LIKAVSSTHYVASDSKVVNDEIERALKEAGIAQFITVPEFVLGK